MASQDWSEREDSELRLSEEARGACSEMEAREPRLSGLARPAHTRLEGGEPFSSSMCNWSSFKETVDRLMRSNTACTITFRECGGGDFPHEHL